MISIILYGRNDAHGYNLHRRAALSLNCLAEALTDSEDEIVFVDYNTPDELPTFVEAISDTLTGRCLDRLRVLRVPAAIHRELFASRTHLSALEPVARNAGVRRASPANRWVLSTNTDMVFLSLAGESVSDICADLPDGFYALPRFELPEWIWERLPRSDPGASIRAIDHLGPSLRLNESTVSYEWIRYDAPGDFQLILRSDFEAIDGFNEEMLLGWHVDSNLSRRMFLRRGSIESLEGRIAGYHCNHNRVPTVFHDARGVANDLNRFFHGVVHDSLPDQRASWGLADLKLEEVHVRRRIALGIADRVASVIPSDSPPVAPSDARSSVALTYDSGHVLSFVADSLIVSPADTKIAYIGANPELRDMLGELLAELGFHDLLHATDATDPNGVDALDREADMFVIDLGMDDRPAGAASADYLAVELPRGFERVLLALERLIGLERSRIRDGQQPRRIVLVNAKTVYWDAYVSSQLNCSYTTFHSRVSNATVKSQAARTTSKDAREMARRVIRWEARINSDDRRLRVGRGTRLSLADLRDFAGFGTGWAFPDALGIWTHGRRSELSLTLEASEPVSVLSLGIGGVCVARGESLRVTLLVDDHAVASRDFGLDSGKDFVQSLRRPLPEAAAQRAAALLPVGAVDRLRPLYMRLMPPSPAAGAPYFREFWDVGLDDDVASREGLQLILAIEKPRTPLEVGWSLDERQLGIHVRSLKVE